MAHALVLVLLMCSAPLSGCFAPSDAEELPSADDLEIRPSTWIGGEFQTVAFTADEDLTLYVPYLLRDPATNFVQNPTIVDLNEGETVELTLLAPPRTTTAVVQIGLPGRDAFPVRDVNESWATWVARGGLGAAEPVRSLRRSRHHHEQRVVFRVWRRGQLGCASGSQE